MIQTFSQKLSAHLSSLVPGFEGHYWYFQAVCGVEVICLPEAEAEKFEMFGHTKICPAWQVEDLLRNLHKILYCIVLGSEEKNKIGQKITYLLLLYEDINTAYQKIEEYLWTILK